MNPDTSVDEDKDEDHEDEDLEDFDPNKRRENFEKFWAEILHDDDQDFDDLLSIDLHDLNMRDERHVRYEVRTPPPPTPPKMKTTTTTPIPTLTSK